MKDYLTVVEFAAAGITKQAVYKRIKQDLAPYVKSKTEKRLYQNSGHEKDVTIEWIVLDVKANVALLVSKNVLEAIPYHSEQKKVDSEKSSIRSWLNSDFFFAAFTGNKRLCILNSKVNTPKNIEYGTNRNSCTSDRVFIEEAEHYFPNAEARRVKLIDNEFENLKCFFPWWLRSSGYPAYRAAGVSKDGKILARGGKVTNTSYFVRPALRVYL